MSFSLATASSYESCANGGIVRTFGGKGAEGWRLNAQYITAATITSVATIPAHTGSQHIRPKLRYRLVTLSASLLQRPFHHNVKRGRDFWVKRTRSGWCFAEMLIGHGNRCFSTKRLNTGQHFKEHDTGRVEVGAGVNRLPPGLFRRKICRSTKDRGGLRHIAR